MTVADPLVFAWIALVLGATYAGLPVLVRLLGRRPSTATIPTLAAGLVGTAGVGTALLAMAGLVNAITVVGLHLGWAAALVFWSHRSFDKTAERLLRVAVHLDTHPPTAGWRPSFDVPRPQLAALVLLGATALAVYVLPALAEARLFHPAAYDHLFTVRRMLGGTIGMHVPSPVAGWVASAATLAAVDAARLVHLLPGIFGCLITASVVWAVRRQTRSADAGLLAGFVAVLGASGLATHAPWGALLPLQHASIGEQMAVIALLLGIASRRCVPLFALGGTLLALSPPLTDAPATLRLLSVTAPVLLGLATAGLYSAARVRAMLSEPAAAPAFGLVVFMAGVGLEPARAVTEHDVVARQALQAMRVAGGEPWTIVGGPMPLVRGHRAGRLQGFAAFRACLDAPSPLLGCDTDGRRHVFLFVQKRPFEPAETMSEQIGLLVAEGWARETSGVRLLHDDETLRVYYRRAPNTRP